MFPISTTFLSNPSFVIFGKLESVRKESNAGFAMIISNQRYNLLVYSCDFSFYLMYKFRHQTYKTKPLASHLSQKSTGMSPLETAKQAYEQTQAYERTAQNASRVAENVLQRRRDAFGLCNRTYESNVAQEEAKYDNFKELERRRHALKLEKLEQQYNQIVARERAAVTASEQALEAATKEREERLLEKEAAREACEAAATEYQRLEVLRREAEALVTEQHAVLCESTLLTCGAGLEVQNVVPGFNTCRITIRNLPRDAKLSEVSDLFTQQGIIQSNFLVLALPSRENHQEATVLAVADCGRAIATGLNGIMFRDRSLTFRVSENSNDSNACVKISWRVPSATMTATYSSMEEAMKKVSDLDGKTYKGQKIRALKHFVPSTIRIFGLSLDIPIDQEIYEFAGTSNIKRRLKSCMLQGLFDCILKRLKKAFPNIKMESDQPPKPINDRVVVRVRFENWEDAKMAFKLVDKKKLLPNSPIISATLENLARDKIIIPQQQYGAQERQWKILSEKRSGSDAYVQTRFRQGLGDRGDVYIIQVVGQDKKMVGALKVKVGNMVAGDILDSSLWHPSFASSSVAGKSFFDRIYKEINVYIRNDFKAKALKIYGEASAKKRACQMIREEVNRLAQLETTVILDQASVRFFMHEGLARLKKLVGEDNAVHSFESGRCKIMIKGPDENRHQLRRLIEESRTRLRHPEHHKGENCPICTDEILHPEQLGCGHNYCSECLRHYLNSAPKLEFPLACITCKVPIAIPLLRRFLTPQTFQKLVEAAFSSYLSDPTRNLKYCRTADCEQIYLQSEDPQRLNCPVCLSTVCSACGEEPHDGVTCTQNKLNKDLIEQDRLFDLWVAANNVRRCPGCSIMIEKIDGCNHITCDRCRTHFCWKCGFHGPAGEIYPHLNREHGGVYDYRF